MNFGESVSMLELSVVERTDALKMKEQRLTIAKTKKSIALRDQLLCIHSMKIMNKK